MTTPAALTTGTHDQRFAEMQSRLAIALSENELLRESVVETMALVAADNEGWALLSGMDTDEGPSLDTIRQLVPKTRAFAGANPMVKNGVLVRCGYIWGEGVAYEGVSTRSADLTEKILKGNRRLIFSPPAYEQLEFALGTDGNVFLLCDRKAKKAVRVPIGEIGGHVTSQYSNEIITYFKRVWNSSEISEDGTTSRTEKKAWFPAADNPGPHPASINGVPVEKDFSIEHIAVNRQSEWLWGIPDVFAIMLWARAYKAYLEANWTLTMSLSRWAFKVTAPTASSAARTAAKIAAPITDGSDPSQGLRPSVGDTASMGGGGDLVAVNKAGASLDYEAGRPLAGMVAAGLSISIESLLAETGTVDETLSRATVKVMKARQDVWDAAFTNLFAFFGVRDPQITFPPVRSNPVHRDVQAIATAANTGVLFPKEVRMMMLVALRDFEVQPQAGMPKKGQWKEFTQGLNTAQNGTPPLDPPNPTGGPNAGPQSDGDNQMKKDDDDASGG